MKLITLTMAAFHLSEPPVGLSYCACSLTDMADSTGTLNGMEPLFMSVLVLL